MMTDPAIQEFSLTMERTFTASKKNVFNAWTEDDALKSWFAPSAEFTTVTHELNVTVGGKYRIEMINPNNESFIVFGQYVKINPYEQLIFTWQWEHDKDNINSLITIDLTDINGQTNLTLKHEKLESQESVDHHTQGWNGCISQLEIFVHQ